MKFRGDRATKGLLLAIVSLVAVSCGAQACPPPKCDWPTGTIVILVGSPAGGVNDSVARILAKGLELRSKQSVVVQNLPGNAGIVAAQRLVGAAPDGRTLLLATDTTLAINPSVYGSLRYSARDFEFIANCVSVPYVLAAAPNVPVGSVSSMVDWLKANPDKATTASASMGSRLTTALLGQKIGVDLKSVPYQSPAKALNDIVTGEVPFIVEPMAALLPAIRSNQLKPLAVTSLQRVALLPDVPTLEQAGLKDVVVEGFAGIVAPKGTPELYTAKLRVEILQMISEENVQRQLTEISVLPKAEPGEAFAARVMKDGQRWAEVALTAKIKAD